MNSDRRYQIYINGEILRLLNMIAEKRRPNLGSMRSTAEDVAEDMIKAALHEKYPQLLELRKEIAQMEREALKTIGEKNDTHTAK